MSSIDASLPSLQVRSTTDTSGVGTRKAMPVSLPLRAGMTLPTALAAPVEAGMMFWPAPRPPRQSLARRAIHGLLRRRGGVDGGYQALDDAVLVVDNLGEGRQAVGRARRVRQDIDVLRVRGVVDTHHEHRRVGGGSRDDDLLGAALQVRARLLDHGEDAGRLADDVRALLTPRHLLGVAARVELDRLAVD